MHLFSCAFSVYHNVYSRYSLSNETNDVANCVHFNISSLVVKSVSISEYLFHYLKDLNTIKANHCFDVKKCRNLSNFYVSVREQVMLATVAIFVVILGEIYVC
jgi:hypothetical protein